MAPAAGPTAAVSDGAHGDGNPDFFFLPPLVGDPSSEPTFEPGMFNGRLHPVLTVHTLPAPNEELDACGGNGKFGPVAVPAVPDEEMYKLNWDTDDGDLTAGVPYRLCVWGSLAVFELAPELRTPLGFVDIQPVTGGMKNLKTGEVFTFNDGRVIPIKFRIEQGALSYDPDDQTRYIVGTEFTVDDGGGSAVLVDESGDTLLAAVDIPAGAISTGDEVTIVIAQEEPQYPPENPEGIPQCLPGGLLQSNWCYQIRTEPALYPFQTDVRVEICVDADPVPVSLRDDLLVHKSSDGETVEYLPWAEPTIIGSDCSGFPEFGGADGILGWLGQWATRIFAPRELRASVFGSVPKGLGGTGGSFSDFGGAVPELPDLVVSSLDLQTTNVTPGGMIAYDYTVSNIGGEGPAADPTFGVATYLSSDAVLDDSDMELGDGYSSWTYHLSVGWSQSWAESDVTIPTSVSPGTYYLIVVADDKPGLPPNYYPGVIEADESNNWLAASGVLEVTSIQIDGVLSAGEWDGATVIPVSGDGTTLYVTNDESYIYFAMSIPTPAASGDGFLVRFDNENDGVLDPDEDNICIDAPGSRPGDCHSYESSGELWWGAADLQQNGAWATKSDGAGKVFEVARPLASGDEYDLNLSLGDTVGYCAAYFTGSTYVQYPTGCVYAQTNLAGYAKLTVSGP